MRSINEPLSDMFFKHFALCMCNGEGKRQTGRDSTPAAAGARPRGDALGRSSSRREREGPAVAAASGGRRPRHGPRGHTDATPSASARGEGRVYRPGAGGGREAGEVARASEAAARMEVDGSGAPQNPL